MDSTTSARPTAQRFVDATVELIEQEGGSTDVNLRQVAQRVGCAHTNAYNYFADFDDLLWAAFRRGLARYGEHLAHDLDEDLEPAVYLERLVTNLARFPQDNVGLYRFIASEPIDLDRTPEDILIEVSAMKQWLFDVFAALYAPELSADDAERISNIVLAYIDGETLNLINGRVVPGEDIQGRIVDNALRLVHDLSGLELGGAPQVDRKHSPYPVLDMSGLEEEL